MRNLSLVMLAMALAVGCGDDPVSPDSDSGTTSDAGGDTDGGGTDEDGGGTDEDGGGTDEDGGGGGDDGGTTPTLDCASYCTTIMANCTGANAQYAEEQHCLDVCSSLDEGALGETTGNTLGCRLYHAGAAGSDPGVHCLHAGPTGGSEAECGDPCESFCQIADEQCPDAYVNPAMCRTACGLWATEPAYSTAATSGNSFACRMYHLSVAATTPDPHCEHITPISSTCGGAP